jgi:hypothetical protein
VKRGTRNLLFAAGLIVLLLLGFLIGEHFRGKLRVPRYKSKMAAAGEKLFAKDLLIPVAPEENGFPLLLTRLNELPSWEPNSVPPVARRLQHGKALVIHKETLWHDLGRKERTNTWTTIENWMTANQDGVNKLRSALEANAFDSGLEYSKGFTIPFQHLAKLKRGAQVLAASTLVELHHGKLPEASKDLKGLYSMSRVLRNEPVLISQLVRVAISSVAISTTWESLQAPGWTDSQLVEIQQMLTSESFIHETIRTLEMERIMTHSEFEKFRASNKAAADELGMMNDLDTGINLPGMTRNSGDDVQDILQNLRSSGFRNFYVPLWRFAWLDQDQAHAMESAQAVIAAARKTERSYSYSAFKSASEKWPKADDKPWRYDRWRYAFSFESESSLGKSVLKAAQAEVYRSLALSAVALKRYELKNHKLPATLEELVPEFLVRVPLDFFDGKPLRYRLKQGPGFVLYSVNVDGVDNGGDPDPADTPSLIIWSERDAVWPEPGNQRGDRS